MQNNKDFYKILGVSTQASQPELKKAYRELVKKYHPDLTKGDKEKEEKFKEISAAYDVLGDEKKRKEYDLMRSNPFAGGGGFDFNQNWGGAGGRRKGQADWGPFEYSTYTGAGGANYEDLGDIFGEIFGNMRGPGSAGRRPAQQQAGGDLHHKLKIDFIDAIKGTTIKVALPHLGRTEKLNVKIPPGVDTGSKVRVAGKGQPGRGAPGDLYIEIEVGSHPYFKRRGDDLLIDAPITLQEAIAGATIEIPSLDGRVKVKVPAGVQSGQQLRLKGKGVYNPKLKQTGDQYVVLQIHLPKSVGEKAKSLLEELEKLHPYQPRDKFYI